MYILYIIQVLICMCINSLGMYTIKKDDNSNKRETIIAIVMISILSFIPIFPIIISVMFIGGGILNLIYTWLENEPTYSNNISNHISNYVPPVSKEEKKHIPIINRFEILDL